MTVLGSRVILLASLVCLGCSTQSTTPEGHETVAQLDERLAARGDDYEIHCRLASACLDIVDSPHVTGKQKLEYAQKALAHCDAATKLKPNQVWAHYYRAVSLGRVLEHTTLPGRDMIAELEVAGLRAREIDPAFKNAGPLRFLALLYEKAPPFPFSPIELAGEEEEIEKLWREALRLAPNHAENYVCFAEFLLSTDRRVEALKHTRTSARLINEGHADPIQREDLEKRISKLTRELGE